MRQVDPDKIVRFSVFFTAENVSVVERIIGAKCTSPCKFVSHFLMHRLPLCVCACPRVFQNAYTEIVVSLPLQSQEDHRGTEGVQWASNHTDDQWGKD
jgi:hypothetical protein